MREQKISTKKKGSKKANTMKEKKVVSSGEGEGEKQKEIQNINKYYPKNCGIISNVSSMSINDKGRTVLCLKCKGKRYCIPFVTAWYVNFCQIETCFVNRHMQNDIVIAY
ncbi:hypothetical protein ACFE04_010727 [Oxalis oulophora]